MNPSSRKENLGNKNSAENLVEPLPTISVITPSFNQSKFIEATINSVLNQGYSLLEYILIDGGSSDETLQVIKKYQSSINYWVSEKDNGQSHAINKGFKRAKGDILAWLNSDDVYCPDTLNIIGQYFAKNPHVMLLSGYCNLSDPELNIISVKKTVPFSHEHFLEGGNVPGQPAIFFRKEILELVGYLNEDLHYVMDWEYWLRISMAVPSSQICFMDRPLATARLWDQAKTSIAGAKSIQERESILNKYYYEWTQFRFIRTPLYFVAFGNLYKRYAQTYWQKQQYYPALSNLAKYVNHWCQGKLNKGQLSRE